MRRFVFACLIAACAAMAPTLASAGDQEIAQHIVQQLSQAKEQGQLKGFDLDLHVDQGTVWLKGFVTSDAQKKLVIDAARDGKDLGVKQIVDDIQVRVAEEATAAPTVATRPVEMAPVETSVASTRRSPSAETPRATPVSTRPVQQEVQVAQHQQPVRNVQPVPTAARRPVQHSQPLASAPAHSMQVRPVAMQQQAPAYIPTANARPAGAYYDQPNVPNYAWPSYAAHPNYSAVTYPTQYSPTAWPYIGPFYPYPQVPLGWRKVTMEWDDGWWYLDFHDR